MADKVHVSQYDGTMVKVGGRFERFDKGSAIPAHADEDHVKTLVERGMVVEGEPFAGLTHENVGPAPFDVDADAKASNARAAKSSS